MNYIEAYEAENRLNVARRQAAEYCTVLVHSGHFTNGTRKWYWMLEGQTMFCKIRRDKHGDIQEFYPCRLTQTKIYIGRSISGMDCVIV